MDIRATRSRAIRRQATRDSPLTPVPRPTDTQATRDIPPILVPQTTETRAARPTLSIPDLAMDLLPMDLLPMAIRAITLRRIGRLGPSTLSNPLAEFPPKVQPPPLVSGAANAFHKKRIAAEKLHLPLIAKPSPASARNQPEAGDV
jgi:hypothetical protein